MYERKRERKRERERLIDTENEENTGEASAHREEMVHNLLPSPD